jgi:cytochrome c-type biogenesis protein CcmH/NrfG
MTESKISKSHKRWALWGAAAVVVVVMFAFGYSLSRIQPEPATGELASEYSPVHMPGAGESGGQAKLPSISQLLAGLEAKVKANPNDANQRTLLAQSYAELGERDKSIEQYRIVHKQTPQDTQVTIHLATVLLDGNKPAELNEAFKLLEEALRAKPAVLPMVRLYQGDIRLRLGDAPGAVKIWKDYLSQAPKNDERRVMFERKITEAGGRT